MWNGLKYENCNEIKIKIVKKCQIKTFYSDSKLYETYLYHFIKRALCR